MTKIPQKEPSKYNIVPGSRFSAYSEAKQKLVMDTGCALAINDVFIPLWNVTTGVLFLAGGYGSSKTTYAITRLLVKCMENKYFRCFYGRQKMTEVRVSLHSNIITEIKRNGWQHLFTYAEGPTSSMNIVCKANGNSFIAFGCDDVDSLKGIDNPSDILVDEVNQIEFKAFGMLLTRLRRKGCDLQFMACFNNCDVFENHWLKKYFYNEEEITDEKIRTAVAKKKVTKHHSCYKDNHFIDQEEYLAGMILQAGGDPVRIEAICNGEWGAKMNAQPFYKMFNPRMHVAHCEYNPKLCLHVSWDENVNPYLPVLVVQMQGNDIYVIDEIAAENPYNTLRWVCNELTKRYGKYGLDHKAGMIIYGDATSRKDDVKAEKGKDFFQLAKEYLSYFNPKLRVSKTNPNVAMRGNFMNAIFGINYNGIFITVAHKCKNLIADLMNTAESPDGNGKDKTKTKVNGISGVQRWGHFSDGLEYVVVESRMRDYLMFQNGGKSPKMHFEPRQAHNYF